MFKLINATDIRNKIQIPACMKRRKIRYFINPPYAQERRKYTILLLKTLQPATLNIFSYTQTQKQKLKKKNK
jgi:hypothetical protein